MRRLDRGLLELHNFPQFGQFIARKYNSWLLLLILTRRLFSGCRSSGNRFCAFHCRFILFPQKFNLAGFLWLWNQCDLLSSFPALDIPRNERTWDALKVLRNAIRKSKPIIWVEHPIYTIFLKIKIHHDWLIQVTVLWLNCRYLITSVSENATPKGSFCPLPEDLSVIASVATACFILLAGDFLLLYP